MRSHWPLVCTHPPNTYTVVPVSPSDCFLLRIIEGLAGLGEGFDKGEAGRQRRSRAAADAVRVILSHADGDGAKASDIMESVLKHKGLKLALDAATGDATEREVKDDIIRELVQSLMDLKRQGRGSDKWHAYHYILDAIVPADCKHPVVLSRVLKAPDYKMIKKVSERKALLQDTGDWRGWWRRRVWG